MIGSEGVCDACVLGFRPMDGHCVKTTGCMSAAYDPISLKETCVGCMAQYNFVYVERNGTCVCKEGHELVEYVNQTKVCRAKCGDGI